MDECCRIEGEGLWTVGGGSTIVFWLAADAWENVIISLNPMRLCFPFVRLPLWSLKQATEQLNDEDGSQLLRAADIHVARLTMADDMLDIYICAAAPYRPDTGPC